VHTKAFWLRSPGQGEIRSATLREPREGEVLVRTIYSGISRGTELLVWRGGVPAPQHQSMRAPFQEGEFPGPVKYGYLNVGQVERGPTSLVGQTVFCLYPHQTHYVVPSSAVRLLPAGVTPRRAVLAGTLETAINALWDAPALIGDQVGVIGVGIVGACLGRLLAQMPGVSVTLIDVDPSRAHVAKSFGASFATPDQAPENCDLVFHTSATEGGLQLALDLLAPEGKVVELSWYGARSVNVSLGGSFHARRLGINCSQVGGLGAATRRGRTLTSRLELALALLRDDAFDVLLSEPAPFAELPTLMQALAQSPSSGTCQLIDYSAS
jgi:2-desacetyl-2-hydroxyethyl bacteriochlorophyllide A dehydrogenase